MTDPAKVRRVLELTSHVIRAIPGAIDVVDANARKIMGLADDFTEKHWGAQPSMRVTTRVNLPNIESGIVALGPLVSITYEAKKGRKTSDWEHHFEGELPILSYAHDGSGLVIVRENSRYTVTKRGIEG